MRLYRLDRDEKPLGDLPVGVRTGQMLQNLAFTFGQLIEIRIDFGNGNRRKGLEHKPGQLWRKHRPAFRHSGDGRDEVLSRNGLRDVATSPRPHDGHNVLRRVGCGQCQKLDGWVPFLDPLDHRLPSPGGHMDVQQYYVGSSLVDHLDGGLDLRGFAHYVDPVPQLGPNPRPKQVMVVDDKHPDRHRSSTSSTSVPPPIVVRTEARPPLRSSLLMIDSRIPCRSAGTLL